MSARGLAKYGESVTIHVTPPACSCALKIRTASLREKAAAQWTALLPSWCSHFLEKMNLLVQWRKSLAASDARRRAPGLVGADHCVLDRAETADACLIDGNWMPFSVVGNVYAAAPGGVTSRIECVAAFGSRVRLAQRAGYQASGCLARNAGTSCATQRGQIGRKSHGGVGGSISYFRCVDGTNGTHRRRLIGCHFRPQQVGDRNAAMIKMIATTISSSMSEKPSCLRIVELFIRFAGLTLRPEGRQVSYSPL